MRAASREALSYAYECWQQQSQDATDMMKASEEMFSVVNLLSGSDRLTNALTDPGRAGEDKAAFARRVFSSHVSQPVVELLAGMASRRWSAPEDFLDGLSQLAIYCALLDAQKEGVLEQVEDEALRLARTLSKQVQIRTVIRNRNIESSQRQEILVRILAGKVTKQLEFLAAQGVLMDKGHSSVITFIRQVARHAGLLRDSLVASVTCAVTPSEEQIARLTSILEKRYEKNITVRVAIDETVLGGMRVSVGGEVLNGTIAQRLADLKKQINR